MSSYLEIISNIDWQNKIRSKVVKLSDSNSSNRLTLNYGQHYHLDVCILVFQFRQQ